LRASAVIDVSAHPPLAMTMGDPAGVGPELALRAWLARDAASPPFFVLADPAALAAVARRLDFAAPIAEVAPSEAAAVFARALPVAPLAARADARPGAPSPEFAAATIESIERAVAAA
jgi:4-hydroxythreonine-4-phosphate dehydrogenase